MIETDRSDNHLKDHLESLSCKNSDFWSFRGKAVREHSHGYFQYPAMMVPQMQRSLIEAAQKSQPDIKWVFDPFMGSGTVLTEALMLGLNFAGKDINPLAVLSCRAKKGPFRSEEIKKKSDPLRDAIAKDNSNIIEAKFPGLEKWFSNHVSVEISRIRRAIQAETALWARRFFWIALAEAIRLTSNSRTSTFKLHIRKSQEIHERHLSPISLFFKILNSNIKRLKTQETLLKESGFISNGQYKGIIDIRLKDSMAPDSSNREKYDLLVTSPPYGDNATTVPYGQYSYLPLQWIDFKDISRDANNEWLKSTHEIDSRSLGGSKKMAKEWIETLSQMSPSYNSFIQPLNGDARSQKVTAFCKDFYLCLDPILSTLKPNAYMFWTLGNRRVAGKMVPMDAILRDFLETKESVFVEKIKRVIPSKRMAIKNNFAETIKAETVLVMRKAGENG